MKKEQVIEVIRAFHSDTARSLQDMKDKPNFVEVKPPKLKRDWKGCTVRTVRDIKNSFFAIPSGTMATISLQSTVGSELTAAPCQCCGIQAIISRVPPKDFVFVEPAREVV